MERTDAQKSAPRQVELMIAIAQHDAAAKGEPVIGSEVLERNTSLKDLRAEISDLEAKYGKVEGRYVRVAGVSFRTDHVNWLAENPHVMIQLESEPDNEFDPNAIKVIAVDHVGADNTEYFRHLGYVPKDVTEIVHTILKAEALVDTVVIEVTQPQIAKAQKQAIPRGIKLLAIFKYSQELTNQLDALTK